MNLTEAAHRLGVSARTLRLAVERGEIEAQHPLADGPGCFTGMGSKRKGPPPLSLASGVARTGRNTRRSPATLSFSSLSST